MRQTPLIVALALLASPAARADTVEASSTTFLTVGQQTRYKGGTKPDLVTVAPAFEVLSISARDITVPGADFAVVLSTFGSVELAKRRWDNGVDKDLTGDVTTGYVQARLLDRHLTLRVGRTSVATGIARMIQIDGGEAVAVVPAGPLDLRLSGYGGVPTSQRFQTRDGDKSWNPTGGTVAYGGRAALVLPVTGLYGRGLELGGSYNEVKDHSAIVRQEVGGDARVQLSAGSDLALRGFATYSLYDERFSEANALLSWSATRRLHLTADWRFVEPDLLLARNSILSVFTASTWNEYGVGMAYEVGRGLHLGADGHLRVEPGKTYGDTHAGAEVAGRLDWESGRTAAGLEVSYLDAFLNGYTAGRVYGKRDLGRTFLAADLMTHFFRESVNGHGAAVTGTVSLGLNLPKNFTAVLAGSAGLTPYLEQTADVMVKLAYNQTYRSAEVR